MLEWKEIDSSEYEASNSKYDFHLSKDGKKWVLDIFETNVSDSDEAHETSEEFASKKEAQEYAATYE